MAEINIFNYIPGKSRLHKLHPSIKIILMLIISGLTLYGDIYFTIYYFILSIIATKFCKIKIGKVQIKYLIFIFVSMSVFQYFFSQGVDYSIKIVTIILYGNIFTSTTKPSDITPGLYILIRNRRISENLSLTIRLIPMFLLGWSEINDTLNSRGLFVQKNPFRKIYYITIPLLVETIKRADNISAAMDSRNYNGWTNEEIKYREIYLSIIIIVLLPCLLLIKKL
ncbi:MAG: energy-coupling factor transporter transmembrane protein EcfT [Spirochaetales bacterium]|nr:energy-coupling factor transporter transmembrane protein EcfT [Spirochaetales bacterium]